MCACVIYFRNEKENSRSLAENLFEFTTAARAASIIQCRARCPDEQYGNGFRLPLHRHRHHPPPSPQFVFFSFFFPPTRHQVVFSRKIITLKKFTNVSSAGRPAARADDRSSHSRCTARLPLPGSLSIVRPSRASFSRFPTVDFVYFKRSLTRMTFVSDTFSAIRSVNLTQCRTIEFKWIFIYKYPV